MAHAETHYPKSIFFLIGNELCEQFNYYGLRGILILYISETLMYDDRKAKIIYHSFAAAIYILPLFGTIMADSYWGKYKTIFYFSFVYVAGNILLGMSAMNTLNLPQNELGMVALLLIAIGTGGIKPCVVAFGGEQFKLPEQNHEMESYFHLFYFFISVGSFISLIITPLFSKRFSCLGEDTCYPLAFFVPAVLTIFALAVFKAGAPLYRIVPPSESMLVKVTACIRTAMYKKITHWTDKKEHWLDHSIEEFGEELVEDTKGIADLLLMFMSLPLFWALYEQQASSWTFQARHLIGNIGKSFTILPEQLQVINPALILIFIPLFEYVLYPFLSHLKILRTPLQRMTTGSLLAVVAFLLSASVQWGIEGLGRQPLKVGFSHLRVYHIFNCVATVRSEYFKYGKQEKVILPMTVYGESTDVFTHMYIAYLTKNEGPKCNDEDEWSEGVLPARGKYVSCYAYQKDIPVYCNYENVTRTPAGTSMAKVVVNLNQYHTNPIMIKLFDSNGNLHSQFMSDDQTYRTVIPGIYGIEFCCSIRYYVTFGMGGVYVVGVVVQESDYCLEFCESHQYGQTHRPRAHNTRIILVIAASSLVRAFEVFPPHQIHMLSLVPQYAVMTAAEVMVAVTGLDFAHLEVEDEMASVVQSYWFLTIGVGQLIVVFIELIRFLERDSSMYLLYAGLMFVNAIVFIHNAHNFYTYVYFEIEEEDEDDDYD